MEYIKIGDGKMLLTLSAEDMEEYNGSRLGAIRKIVNDVHEKYGGDGFGGRIFVRMYESKDGGCELFVTKLSGKRRETMQSSIDGRIMTEYREYGIREICTVYEFGGLEELLLCCKLLTGSGYRGRSESYADRAAGKYYLVLDGESAYPAEAMGESVSPIILRHIREHCTKLFGDHSAGLLGRLAQ